jgi:hypothetical protein
MVYDFERNKIRQQEIEVRALVALLKHSRMYRVEAEQRLRYIAFPDQLAEKINNEQTLSAHAKMHAKMDSMLDKLEYQ